jgi:hypothetical protein
MTAAVFYAHDSILKDSSMKDKKVIKKVKNAQNLVPFKVVATIASSGQTRIFKLNPRQKSLAKTHSTQLGLVIRKSGLSGPRIQAKFYAEIYT